MLTTLTVWNFALIAHAEIDFRPGLNILTGETGAGKSILIDALGAVLGHRLSADTIRTGCDWLRVEAVFDIAGQEALKDFLLESMIDLDGTELIITRQLTAKGKSSVLANGCRITLSVLRTIGEYLFDVHGQNENLAILKPENKFRLIDGSDSTIDEARKSYQKDYTAWKKTFADLKEREEKIAAAAEKKDMLSWQAEEIAKIAPKIGEDDELEARIKKLANAEKISDDVESIRQLLGGYGEALGAVAGITEAVSHLEHLDRYDAALSDLIERLENAAADLADALDRVNDYHDSLEFDPTLLDHLQSRQAKIDRLKKKYGPTIEAILEKEDALKKELSLVENGESDIAELKKELAKNEAATKKKASLLSQKRQAAAKKMSEAITHELAGLGMANARFSCVLSESPSGLGENGADSLELMFSANAGEPLKPLANVASGGELSRLSLAIKSAAVESDSLAPSMVFDEIDTGIGGRTAQMVANRIANVSRRRQVLCITHLAAIASMADQHLYLAKAVEDGQTTTTVRPIEGEEKIAEIARMASGLDFTPAALDNAREMLDHAQREKERLA